ncbi:NAD(P)/FAD-dependent oxidoreductase [Aspergillus homomorphus CBS 101889]|uniref:FAD dependent oxidoreductase superfamily n=1 Tax=Aspergillus homomorphus (strain CBS 101889) TaxID=1450537 RepID=A0A395HGR1_ASPHC|nr:FAD dependent oxidoreductase superfamily [Aspergillus homomorphus CBS 101889]RAL06689.1 FAD dependent oxidoreductase superfamily [Aspergillus homomorphus CBS 101889]
MATVILGGGIIGTSIAYYLSESQPAENIHVVDSSSKLFCSASGYAAGFMARDWFAPSLAPLGDLSFRLHETLAAENGGAEKWGYMKGSALSLGVAKKKGGKRGDDWLRTGTSRAETAAGSEQSISEPPSWLTRQHGAEVEKISEDDDTAQVDPLRLCSFLLDACMERGVKIHNPAKATSLAPGENGAVTGVKIENLETKAETIIACSNLIICAGPWTQRVIQELFPIAKVSLPIYSLAGYSLVLRSPRYTVEHEQTTYKGRSQALFTTYPPSCGFCPELFSRQGAEVYIAGLNTTQIPLPERADDYHKSMEQKEMDRLKAVSVRLLGKLAEGSSEATDEITNIDDLEVLREGLCFRPASERGTPFVGKIEDDLLGGVKAAGGVYVAAGHGPWGISLSLGTGKVIAEMVRGVTPSADVSGLGV